MTRLDKNPVETGLEIAVIGMSGKFPGAKNLEEFWENLKNGVESISTFSIEELKECGIDEQSLENPNYVRAYGVVEDKAYFDSSFFGYSPKEAETMDPVIRLFHECAWEALEDAGYDPISYNESIGLYAGSADGFGWRAVRALRNLNTQGEDTGIHITGTGLLLSTRISHKLDLKGPSITMFTACSTSLVAIHTACRALLTGECHMALAGAGAISASEKSGYIYQEGMILSPDGHCRPFDIGARGTVFGDGIGVVVLKRLKAAAAEGDTIRAVIKASAINNDGIDKASFTAPGKKRIADVIRTVLKLSRLAPEDIDYIETHGTATPLGDTIEVEALKEAFAAGKKGYCGIGSHKSNIGHLDVAAGMAGFIKTVQALMHRLLPPTLYFETPHPGIDLINSPFYLNAALSPWQGNHPLRAGVCAYGIGGTNAFIVVEEALAGNGLEPRVNQPAKTDHPYRLILLSARNDAALEKMAENLATYLKKNPWINLTDAAYTLQVGRRGFSRRRMMVGSSVDEVVQALSTSSEEKINPVELPVEAGVDEQGTRSRQEKSALEKIGRAWLEGALVDWRELYPGGVNPEPRRIPLPTYPFERQYFWITPGAMEPAPGKDKNKEKKPGLLYQRPALSTEYTAPGDDLEKGLAEVWQRFFGIKEIGIHDDFFEMGGDSLKAITVVTEIHKQLEARIPISALFQSPTIHGLAQYIKGTGKDRYSAIEPGEEKEYYSLSSVQRRIYTLQQMEINSTGYNTPLIFDLEGYVDKIRLEQVFKNFVERHESLRTSFQWVEGETVQRINPTAAFTVDFYDLAARGDEEVTKKEEQILEGFIKPFDLSRGPLLRVGLITILPTLAFGHPNREGKEGKYLLMVDMHHIVSDGSSIGILIREFTAMYSGQTLSPLRIRYKDYTQWQNSEKSRERMKQQGAFWEGQFSGEIPVLNLPVDFVRPSILGFSGNTILFKINREETEALKQVAENHDATLFMVLLTLYNVWLAKICVQEDIVVGTPITGRTHADLQSLIGMLVNTLALRNYPSGRKTFKEFLREVKENTLAAFENQDYLFEDLVENVTLNIHRELSRNPIFDTMFNLMNFQSQYEADLKIDLPGLSLAARERERGISIFDISMHGMEAEQGLWFKLEFSTKLFKPETIHRLIGYFKQLVSVATASPDSKIAHMEIISEAEKKQILQDFIGPELIDAPGKPIAERYAELAKKLPDHMALVYERRHLTYRDLKEKSQGLAGWLRLKGVGPDVIVGIMVERSLEMIIALLAVIKAGGACLPIDPQYPEARKKYIIRNSSINLLLTEVEKKQQDFIPDEVQVIPLSDESIYHGTVTIPTTLETMKSARDLLYLLYTSGSTGAPKGAMLEQRTLLNLIHYQYRYTSIDFSQVLQFASLSFDVSFQEIFSTLLAGGRLVLVPQETVKNTLRLYKVINENQIRTLFFPSSFLKFLFNDPGYSALFPGCVGHIIAAGEQMVVSERLRNYLRTHQVNLHNHYGPTETHIVTALTLDLQGEIPTLPFIGKPVANTLIYIVDRDQRLQPVGIPGELLCGGIQIGRGYLNRPELTAERFPSFSFKRIHRFYRSYISYKTGDLARWVPGGHIEFLGRLDTQVKIRGYRIELGEIENQLLTHEAIENAVVIDWKKPGNESDKYLCAYIVTPGGIEPPPDKSGLKEYLSQRLPEYMIPSFFVPMERIPLNPNGKVDRKALPEPVIKAEASLIPPSTPEEKILAELWSEVLGIEKSLIGLDTDFFQVGGHSLKAALLTARIHKFFNVEVSLGEIFRHPRLRDLAPYLLAAKKDTYLAIEPLEKKEYYPLSSAQQRLYVLQHLDPGTTVYNMPNAILLEGRIDLHQLEQTFRQLMRRHEVFRTSFITVNEKPVQRIHGENFRLPITNYQSEEAFGGSDAPGLVNTDGKETPRTRTQNLDTIIKNFIRPFDLSEGPLLRVGLIELSPPPALQYLLMVDLHHIISDGTSERILIREFKGLTQGEILPPLRIQYKDYAGWQNREAVKEKINPQEEYWLKEFSGEIPVLNLPYDGPRPVMQSFVGSNSSFVIAEAEMAALNRLALDQGVTLFMVLVALFNVLLSKLSGQEDIVIGTPTAGRGHADLEALIGMFVNTLALRNYPQSGKTFCEFLQEVKTRTLDSFANQDYQFEQLVEQVVVTRDPGRSPLFDVMLGLQNMMFPLDELPSASQPASDYNFDRGVSRLDLTWNAVEKQGRLMVEMEYSTLLFKKETIAGFVRCFKQVVTFVVTRFGQRGSDFSAPRIEDIEIISPEEKQRILYEFNPPVKEYPRNKTIQGLFAEQVERIPDQVALVGPAPYGGPAPDDCAVLSVRPVRLVPPVSLTYRELNERSGRLAHILIEKGVQPDTIVGIMMERSAEMIIGLLGILKAGGAYLPIDPGYPEERIHYMLADSAAKLLVVANNLEEVRKLGNEEVKKKNGTTVFVNIDNIKVIEDLPNLLTSQSPNFHLLPATGYRPLATSLAYVIYTSGTTGRPKGVLVRHQNVVQLVRNSNFINFTPHDRLLPTGSMVFDITAFEIWWPLLNGLSLVLANQEVILDAEKLGSLLARNKVSILHLTPQLFNQLAAQRLEIFAGLTYFLVGGDLVRPQYLNLLRNTYKNIHILHMYGPTENTVFSTFHPVNLDYDTVIPIGKPLSNSLAYILDQSGQLAPIGVPGELWVGGDGVTRGYLNNPEMTAQKFIDRSPIIFYQTGDLARWQPDGNIEFLGRIDTQVKIRGFRVETGEIERCLLEIDHIKEALVVAKDDDQGEKYLCAYVVSGPGVSSSRLKNVLAAVLPDYMLPTYFISIDRVPLTSTGKVDRRALPEPHWKAGKNSAPPRNPMERKLRELWSEILGITKDMIGIDSNFFEMGGHSLKATVLMTKIHRSFNIKLSLAEIFKQPTIKGLAGYIKKAKEEKYTPIEPAEKKEYYPLSSPQKRLYILQQMDLKSTVYHISQGMKLEMASIGKLEEIFHRLIRRHESLRTAFVTVNQEPVQQILEENPRIQISNYHLHTNPKPPIPDIIKAFIRPFDLAKPPLLRVGMIHLDTPPPGHSSQGGNPGDKPILVVDMHHLISDGTSMSVLLEEIRVLSEGKDLPGLHLQYKDYARWQVGQERVERLKNQEEYWVNEFSAEIPVLNLTTDYPRPTIQSFAGGTVGFEIGEGETARLKTLALEHRATLFMVLLSIVNILLTKLGGQEDIVIGTPMAGRRHADIQRIIGMFVNTLALRNYPRGEKTFSEFLAEVKSRTLEAFENQDYPFEDLVEKASVPRDAGRNPLFDVMFSWQNIQEDPGNGMKPATYAYEDGVSRFDMTWIGTERGDRLVFEIEYCTQLFKKETLLKFTDYFKKLMAEVTAGPGPRISRLEIITEEGKKQVLYDFNETPSKYPVDKAIHELFEERAEVNPDRVALVGTIGEVKKPRGEEAKPEEGHLSYRELKERSDQLAGLLIEKGVKPDTIVGIRVERCVEMIIGVLGILKTGGAYLPIDPGYPEERINYMLSDSAAKVLVTTGAVAKHAGAVRELPLQSIALENAFLTLTSQPPGFPLLTTTGNRLPATSLAYVIYTSGSTGKPKGTMIGHAGVVNILFHLQKLYPLGKQGVYLLKTNYTFDVSVTELFGWFVGGGRLAVLERDAQKDPGKIVEAVERYAVTHINFVPAMFIAFVESLLPRNLNSLSTLRYIFLAGEELLSPIIKRFRLLAPRIALENLYGPTEATIYATGYSMADWNGTGKIPIGKPLANVKVYIFDKYDCLQPPGIPGELGISGQGISRGYLNNPELTAEKFCLLRPGGSFVLKVTDAGDWCKWRRDSTSQQTLIGPPRRGALDHCKNFLLNHSPLTTHHSPIYKTGDLARWHPDGNIEFLGRIDTQIKIRGYRIELREIENRLLAQESIREVVVTQGEDRSGDRYLCAYVVWGAGAAQAPRPADLKEYLSRELPDYMIPAYFVPLGAFPLTSTGKIDRKALPEPGIKAGKDYTAPRDEIEKKLARVWSEVLGREALAASIGIDDNFFALGGHSLKATIMAAKLHKEFDVKVPLQEIFKSPTLRRQALFIKTAAADRFVPLELEEKKEFYPLSYNQKRLWVIQQMAPGSSSYHMPAVIPLKHAVDIPSLEKTLSKLFDRHESLRTGFKEIENYNEPVQFIPERVEIPFEVIDISTLEEKERQSKAEAVMARIASQPLDLRTPPLFRAALIKKSPEEFLLVYNIHHIVTDGWSMEILRREFTLLYEEYLRGKEAGLEPVLFQYKDFAAWHNRQIRGRENKEKSHEYWRKKLETGLPPLNWDRYYCGPREDKTGAGYRCVVEPAIIERLQRLAAAHNTTLFMVLFSLYNLLLAYLSGQEAIVTGIISAGRQQLSLYPIVGYFINLVVVKTRVDLDGDFENLLAGINPEVLEAFQHQNYSLELVLEDMKMKYPQVSTAFNLLNMQDISPDLELESLQSYHLETKPDVKFEITLFLTEYKNGLEINWDYQKNLFKPETIEDFANKYLELMTEITA